MLIQSLRNMMKPLMWATLILIIPSFIALYGYQGIQQRRAREAVRALTVNGSVIDMDTYFRARTQELNNQRQGRGGHWYEGLEQELNVSENVIEALITQELLAAKARQLGISISDKELSETIQRMFGGENFHPAWYHYTLQRAGYSVEEFENSLRQQLAGTKIRELIQLSYHPTEEEMRDSFRRTNTKFQAEFLRFLSKDYQTEVQIDQEGLEKYFAEHKAQYKVPEKVRLRYLRLTPRDFEQDVRVLREDMKAYYDQHRDDYEIPEQAEVEEIFFPTADCVKDVTADQESIRSYFEDHIVQFRLPEQRAIQYTYIPVEAGADPPQLPLAEVREYYQKHIADYEVKREEANAQHILLVLAPDASAGEEQAVLDRLLDIEAEIEAGKPFDEAAREYSEDKLTSEEGGDLGWFGYADPHILPELKSAAFELDVGEISEPLRTSRGFHLLYLVDRQPERTKPLEEVEEYIRRMLAGERLQRLRYEAQALGFGERITGATYPLVKSQTFTRSAEAIDETIGEDSRAVASAAFGMATEEVSRVIRGGNNYYLFELVEIEPSREPTLEEARDEVRETLLDSKAKRLAETAAVTARDRISGEGIPFEELARGLGKQVRRLGPFQAGDELPEIGERSETFIQSALALENGEISTVGGEAGVHLVRVVNHEESRIPDLEEVTHRVKRSVGKEKAPAYTEEIANDVLNILEEEGADLTQAIPLALEKYGVSIPSRSSGETTPTSEDDPVSIPGWESNVTSAGLRLREVGERATDPIPVFAGPRRTEVTDFFLIELLERIPEHEPELSEVREKVEKDYRFHLATQMAKQRATEAYQALREAAASGGLADATKQVDLVSFARRTEADYGVSEQPFAADPPALGSPFYRAEPVLKTIYHLNAGELSGIIEVTEEVGTGEQKKERTQGYYIVQLTERQEPNMDEFPAAREEILRSLSRRGLGDSYPSFVESMKRSADIVRHEALQKYLAFERGEITEEEYRGTAE